MVVFDEGIRIGREPSERPPIELEQDLNLPAIEHAGADSGQIGAADQREHFEAFRSSYVLGEFGDQLRLRGVAAKCQVRHQQMLMDQELERLAIFGAKTEPLGVAPRNSPADFGVVLFVAFAQVVDQ